MKRFFLWLIAGLFFVMPQVVKSETLNVLIYCPAINLSTASNEDKLIFLEGLVPDNIVATQAWQNATLASKAQWARDNGYLSPYMERKTLVPLLKSILTDKYDVLINYMMITAQSGKYVFHCLLEKNGKLPNVKAWIDSYNEGKTDANKIWYWYGDTVDDSYQALWTDESEFAHEVAIRVLRYPAFYHLVPAGVRNSTAFKEASLGEQYQYGLDQEYFTEEQPRMGTVKEAVDNGLTIDVDVLKQYGVLMRVYQ